MKTLSNNTLRETRQKFYSKRHLEIGLDISDDAKELFYEEKSDGSFILTRQGLHDLLQRAVAPSLPFGCLYFFEEEYALELTQELEACTGKISRLLDEVTYSHMVTASLMHSELDHIVIFHCPRSALLFAIFEGVDGPLFFFLDDAIFVVFRLGSDAAQLNELADYHLPLHSTARRKAREKGREMVTTLNAWISANGERKRRYELFCKDPASRLSIRSALQKMRIPENEEKFLQ